jgi:hypothetical protein
MANQLRSVAYEGAGWWMQDDAPASTIVPDIGCSRVEVQWAALAAYRACVSVLVARPVTDKQEMLDRLIGVIDGRQDLPRAQRRAAAKQIKRDVASIMGGRPFHAVKAAV